MELKLFGTDAEKDYFVIFCIDNGEDLNAYVWVYDDGNVRITDISGLERYCNFSVSPIYVGDDVPQEMVENAIEVLKSLDEEKKKELMEEFNDRIGMMKKKEDAYKGVEEYEDAVMKDIENGTNVNDGMFWFM